MRGSARPGFSDSGTGRYTFISTFDNHAANQRNINTGALPRGMTGFARFVRGLEECHGEQCNW
jgi:hypothetical protein